jgi:hypothetical protein
MVQAAKKKKRRAYISNKQLTITNGNLLGISANDLHNTKQAKTENYMTYSHKHKHIFIHSVQFYHFIFLNLVTLLLLSRIPVPNKALF